MAGLYTFLSSTELKLHLVIFAVSAIFFLTRRSRLFRLIRLSRNLRGPSLWEVITVYGIQLWKDRVDPLMNDMTVRYNYMPWGVWGGPNYYVVISDADTIRDAFRSKNLRNKSDIAYSVFTDNLGQNILSCNNENWKVRRQLYNPAYKKYLFEQQRNVICEKTEKALAEIGHHPFETDFDVRHLLETTLIHMITQTFVSMHLDDKECDDTLFYIKSIFPLAMKTLTKPGLSRLSFLWSKTDSKKLQDIKAHFARKCLDAIDAASQRLSTDHNFKIGMPLDVIMSENLKKAILTPEEIVSDLFVFFGAGTDTTNTSLAAVIYLLALHPKVQKRAATEVWSVLGESDDPQGPEDYDRLEYLEQIIMESHRLFPPAIAILRIADEDTVLNGTFVPKGANVLFNIFGLHRNPSSFKDPLTFDPDRFHKENKKMHRQYAFVPFSSGSRDCIGKTFAMLIIKTILSKLLKKYKILPGRGLNCIEDIKWKWMFTLYFNDNFVRFVPLGVNGP